MSATKEEHAVIGVGIVGAGYIGTVHAKAIGEVEGLAVRAVMDAIPEKAATLAAGTGARTYDTLETLVASPEVDVVAVCTPTALHLQPVLQAAHARKHILCEKPMARTLAQADQMTTAVLGAGVVGMVGQVLRFWPEYVRVKQIVDSGALGVPHQVYCERLCVIPDWTEGSWNHREETGGGAALDLQIHDIDFASWLFGVPQVVQAKGVYRPDLGGWAQLQTTLTFANGVVGLIHTGWTFQDGFPFTMGVRVVGSTGTVEWLFRAGKNIEERGEDFPITIYRSGGAEETVRAEKADPFIAEWRYFAECVRRGTSPGIATFADARNALEVALASTASAGDGGRPIVLQGVRQATA